MATTTSSKSADAGNWIHGCFMVKVGTDFDTYQKVVAYAEQDELFGSSSKPAADPAVKKILSQTASGGDNSPLPIYFSKRKCRDTSLGGNDAINPLPQYSVDDDISHPHFFDSAGSYVSMGQVYSENIDDLQQVLYLGFGIPLFSNVGSFWASATDMDLAGFVNSGKGITAEKIGYLIGSAPIRLINIASVPLRYIGLLTDSLQKVPISKYYTFSSQMPMYFRFVNTILVMLATNMNMMAASDALPTTGSNVSGKTSADITGKIQAKGDVMDSLPGFMRNGLDIAQIMVKRFLYENGQTSIAKNRWTDEAMFKAAALNDGEGVTKENKESATQSTNPTANPTNSSTTTTEDTSRKMSIAYIDAFKAAYKDAIYDGHLFIGFRIDKGMGGSESFSNSTGESQISQIANEKYQQGKEAGFQLMHGDIGDGIIGSTIGAAISGAKGIFEGVFSTLKLDPLAAAMTGAARIAIPEVWMSSSYSRTAAFTITCIAPYGDIETIYQSEYVPLACILAGSLPRGTGQNSHSAPFVCQAYCRGVFSSPLCIIESLEITRGADQFGMNQARLPLKLTMHVTLKDLSPVMYMNMGGDRGLGNALFGTEDNFSEYMMTLSGMGLRDRLQPRQNRARKLQILFSTVYKNKLSPFMLGMEGGTRFFVSRAISAIVSGGRNLPGN